MVEYKERKNWGINWTAIKREKKGILVDAKKAIKEKSNARNNRNDTQVKNNKINLPPTIPWRGPSVDIVEQTPNNNVLQRK